MDKYTTLSDNDEAMILERAERILRNRVRDSDALTEPNAVGQMFRLRLAGAEREIFTVAALDTRHRIIDIKDLFYGTIDCAEVHPREVVRYALKHNAAAVMLAHNHPSGNPEPSSADRALTARLQSALKLIDVRILDHFVVGTEGFRSMASLGWV